MNLAASDLLSLCPLRASASGLPLYCFPGAGGGVEIFRQMASILPGGRPVYGISIARFYDANRSFTIEQLADLCLQIIRKNQQHGPYYFCGYSLGGALAYEAANRLIDEGDDVRLLALLDLPNPTFVSNLSSAESVEYRKRYFADRLRKYGYNLSIGNLNGVASDALIFLSSKAGALPWLLGRAMFRIVNKPMPLKWQNNAPMFAGALRAYTPRPYAKKLVLFCRQSLGPEFGIDHTLGWGRLALGGVDVHIVPGSHIGMMGSPQFLVDKLGPELDD
jgi:thioesterase domain-containing protein